MSDLHGLDEHITGNWGEDSINDDDDLAADREIDELWPRREPLTAPNALYEIGEEPWEE